MLVKRCDACERTEDIILTSADGNCLCGSCVAIILRHYLIPTEPGVNPVKELAEVPECSFCEESDAYTHLVIRIADGVWICDTCLLKAARKMGTLKIVETSQEKTDESSC